MQPLHVGLFSYIPALRSWIMVILLASTDAMLPGAAVMYCRVYGITFILSVGIMKWDKKCTQNMFLERHTVL